MNPTINEIKGYKFEQWVVTQFPEELFPLQEWRGDKHVGGRYPASCKNPDLVFKQLGLGRRSFFAVECKWKAQLKAAEYPWANLRKRSVYNNFGIRLAMPVHIALGIGGEADQPKNIFLIPLEKIKHIDYLDQSLLDKYKWPENLQKLKMYLLPKVESKPDELF